MKSNELLTVLDLKVGDLFLWGDPGWASFCGCVYKLESLGTDQNNRRVSLVSSCGCARNPEEIGWPGYFIVTRPALINALARVEE